MTQENLPNPYDLRRKEEIEKSKKHRIAIILVPATGASNIYKKGNSNSQEGYAPDSSLLMVNKYVSSSAQKVAQYLKKNVLSWEPEDLHLGANNWEGWKEAKIGWNQVYSGTYNDFLKHCKEYKEFKFDQIVCAIGYNWARSNIHSAQRILERTEQLLKNLKVDGFVYITHSMGALPVRAAFKLIDEEVKFQNDFPLVRTKCLGVIHVVAPILGAPEAYIRFHRGVPEADIGEKYVLGRTGFKFSVKACFIPSMCEILPFGEYADKTIKNMKSTKKRGLAALSDSLLDLVQYQLINANDADFNDVDLEPKNCLESLRNNLQSAQDFHRFLDGYFFPQTKMIAIEGIPTVMEVDAQTLKEVTGTDGDGTVPVESQKYGPDPVLDLTRIQNSSEEQKESSEEQKESLNFKLKHGDPFKEVGRKAGVFNAIYDFLEELYNTYIEQTILYSHNQALSTGLSALGVGEQPILLNGQQAIFDKAVATTPVALEPKPTHRQAHTNGNGYRPY